MWFLSVSHITVLLEDDTLLSVMCEQVTFLLNFAMTDYSAQGKSRPRNAVDLTNCKDHRAYYVALSRATTAAGTIILQDFDSTKITCGMSGYLRQELRELELLDEITRLRYQEKLPRSVTGIYRRQLIRSYLLWKGDAEDPAHMHEAMKWRPTMGPKIPEQVDYAEWRPSGTSQPKRKAPDECDNSDCAPKQKHRNHRADDSVEGPASHMVARFVPVGLVWDSRDYSCGYDATFTVLANIWRENKDQWSDKFSSFSPLLKSLLDGLNDYTRGLISFENVRDAMRAHLHQSDPGGFPYGTVGTSIDRIVQKLITNKTYAIGSQRCTKCGYIDPAETHLFNEYMCAIPNRSQIRHYPTGVSVSTWLKAHLKRAFQNCPLCSTNRRQKLSMDTRTLNVPSLMFISVDGQKLQYDRGLTFDCVGTRRTGTNLRFSERILICSGFM